MTMTTATRVIGRMMVMMMIMMKRKTQWYLEIICRPNHIIEDMMETLEVSQTC